MTLNSTQAILFELLSLDANKPNAHNLGRISETHWGKLLELANGQHITPLLYAKIKDKGVAVLPNIQQQIQQKYVYNTKRNLSIFRTFRQLSAQLQAANIPMIPLKGVYLADAIYATLGERVIGDLDLLVPKERIAEAIELSAAYNFHPIKPIVLDEWLKSRNHVCPLYNNHTRLTLEWHWHFAIPRPNVSIPIADLWQRAVPSLVSKQSVLALAPEDLILHLAYHISYHHEFSFGIRNLCDLSLICQTYAETIDWDAVEQRANTWQYQRGVYLVLELVQTFLAAPVPDSVLQRLKPADFSSKHLEMAAQQVFILPSQFLKISPTRRTVQGAGGFLNKVRALRQAIFPSAETMAIWYGVEPDSRSRFSRYLLRWQIIIRKGIYKIKGSSLKSRRETGASSLLNRKSHLSTWLNMIE